MVLSLTLERFSEGKDRDDEGARVKGEAFAYGSAKDFGISAKVRSVFGMDEDGSDISNLRNPSWPYSLAFLLIGWAYVRPFELRASKWSLPAAIETNLVTNFQLRDCLERMTDALLSPGETFFRCEFDKIDLFFLAPEPSSSPPRCTSRGRHAL
jgi:hypothetical protein